MHQEQQHAIACYPADQLSISRYAAHNAALMQAVREQRQARRAQRRARRATRTSQESYTTAV